MGRPDFPRSIVDFQERFPDDAACLGYLADSRWPEGFRCPACGGRRSWVLERRHLWECAECHQQTSVTAGTVMHGTRTSLRLWFWAAYLVATHTPGISAKQLQRQLGISRYETAWLILQKLRRAMVAPEREPLRGEVEVDETFVGGHHDGRRGGRQRDGKALVGVVVEVRGQGSGRLRLAVLPDASGDTLTGLVEEFVAPGAIVHTDGWPGYGKLAAAGYRHKASFAAARSPRRPEAPTSCPSGCLQPENLAAGDPPRRLARASSGLPGRVCLPPQPPPHADGGLPDPARPRGPARAEHLPGDRHP